ncbi:thiamine biosynthesis protein ThiH [Salmonella enterica subsp. arizonae]|uniref:Thiamine biosynthesis protein ThiH n=1 Tax=Salmonella enterica subsp. arizonae TaxID=59203 RepID=A0A379SDJ2_SALER|nr:thiamine biosynthesis protein ThiH [Salmonella enterica subsp. arizonae]
MDEKQLVQTICAFRLLAPEIELSLSTRESPWFRDNVIPLAINNVSASRKRSPVGMLTIIRNWSNLRRMTIADLRLLPTR